MSNQPNNLHQPAYPKRYNTKLLYVAIATVLLSGLLFQFITAKLELLESTPINLPVPLANFPFEIDHWEGKEVKIDQAVLNVANNDDYISRIYINQNTRQWANIYIAFTARPRTMIGHRPQICAPALGWNHKETTKINLTTRYGKDIPSLKHIFSKSGLISENMVNLNFYIINGQISNDSSGFDSLSWRTPNINGDIARYVTQVQISSNLENSATAFAELCIDEILKYFPDQNGNVEIADKIEQPTDPKP